MADQRARKPTSLDRGVQFVAIVVCNNQSKFIRKFTKQNDLCGAWNFSNLLEYSHYKISIDKYFFGQLLGNSIYC